MPSYDGRIEIQALNAILDSFKPESPIGNVRFVVGDSLVTRARNKLVKYFIDSSYEYMLFMDSDILFETRHIKTLYDKAVKHDISLMCGVYLKKTLPYQPVMNRVLSPHPDEPSIVEVGESGTGCMLIRRDVFVDILSKYPEIEYNLDGDERSENDKNAYDFFQVGVDKDSKRYLSEDYFFCKLAREVGHKTYVDSSTTVTHRGGGVFPFPDTDLISSVTTLIQNSNPDNLPQKEIETLKKQLSCLTSD